MLRKIDSAVDFSHIYDIVEDLYCADNGRPSISSESSLASAMLAGIAAGVFKNPLDAVAKCVKPKSVTVPNPENTEKYRKVFLEYKKIHDALAPIYDAR